MGFFHHTFSDVYARQNNWLTRIDVRIKLLYVVALLAMNLLSKNVFFPAMLLSASFVLALSVKIPPVRMLKGMLLPLVFAALILIVKGMHEGEREWTSFSLAGYRLALKEEGLRSGLYTGGKVLGGISLVIAFSLTTTINKLCAALTWLRAPGVFVELLAFMYRYIFLFLDEVSAMWTAQKSRMGHASWKKTLQSLGILGGMLIIRAFARAERTYEAMRARGYEGGGILTAGLPPMGKKQRLFVLASVVVLPVLFFITPDF